MELLCTVGSRKHHSLKACLEEKRQQNEKQVMIQLVLIVTSFALGYLPFTSENAATILIVTLLFFSLFLQ